MRFSILTLAQLGLVLAQSVGDRLITGRNPDLYKGQILYSPNALCYLIAQDDGNVVLYFNHPNGRKPRWASDTVGKAYSRFSVNFNGDVVQFTNPTGYDYVKIWPNGKQEQDGPFQMIMQDDGNLVVYTANNKPIWATGTNFITPFSKVQFYNNGRAVVAHPLVKSLSGGDLWNPYTSGDSYWSMFDGNRRTVDFNKDTIKDSSETIGSHIGGPGAVVQLGLKIVAGDDDWIDATRGKEFVYDPSSTACVIIRKYGGLRDGDAVFDGFC